MQCYRTTLSVSERVYFEAQWYTVETHYAAKYTARLTGSIPHIPYVSAYTGVVLVYVLQSTYSITITSYYHGIVQRYTWNFDA
jgi:hypothetical protein